MTPEIERPADGYRQSVPIDWFRFGLQLAFLVISIGLLALSVAGGLSRIRVLLAVGQCVTAVFWVLGTVVESRYSSPAYRRYGG